MKLISRRPIQPIKGVPRFCQWREGALRCARRASLRYIIDEEVKELCYDHSEEYEDRYLDKAAEEAP